MNVASGIAYASCPSLVQLLSARQRLDRSRVPGYTNSSPARKNAVGYKAGDRFQFCLVQCAALQLRGTKKVAPMRILFVREVSYSSRLDVEMRRTIA